MVIIGPSNFSTSSWLPRQILHLDLSDDGTQLLTLVRCCDIPPPGAGPKSFAIATDLACADRLDRGSHLSAGGSKVRTLGPPSVKVRNADPAGLSSRRPS